MPDPTQRLSTDADLHAAMIAVAKTRAAALRREAINDFWDGLGRWALQGAGTSLQSGQRAARRLAARLRQRTRQGAAPSA